MNREAFLVRMTMYWPVVLLAVSVMVVVTGCGDGHHHVY